MKKHSIAAFLVGTGIVMITAGVIASCAPDTTAPVLQTRPTAAPTEETVASLPESTPEQPFTDQACLECHTDQTRLVELAVEPETTESLSEGPG